MKLSLKVLYYAVTSDRIKIGNFYKYIEELKESEFKIVYTREDYYNTVILLREDVNGFICVVEFVFKQKNGKLRPKYCSYKEYIPKKDLKNE